MKHENKMQMIEDLLSLEVWGLKLLMRMSICIKVSFHGELNIRIIALES